MSPLLLVFILEALTGARIQEKENKVIQVEKDEAKLYLFACDMILFLRENKNSNRKCLETMNSFSKKAG